MVAATRIERDVEHRPALCDHCGPPPTGGESWFRFRVRVRPRLVRDRQRPSGETPYPRIIETTASVSMLIAPASL